jgi:hypothetical protein
MEPRKLKNTMQHSLFEKETQKQLLLGGIHFGVYLISITLFSNLLKFMMS